MNNNLVVLIPQLLAQMKVVEDRLTHIERDLAGWRKRLKDELSQDLTRELERLTVTLTAFLKPKDLQVSSG